MLKKFRLEVVVLLIGCLFFGVATIYSSLHFSTWHDESYSSTLIEGGYSDIVRRTSYDVHPPLYYLVLKTWSYVFGHSIASLRLFSALCMFGAVIILWRLVRRALGRTPGLVALAGALVGPFTLRFAGEARMYGLGALLTAVSLWITYKILANKEASSRWLYALLGFVFALGFLTHYFLIFLAISTIGLLVWVKRPKKATTKALFLRAWFGGTVRTLWPLVLPLLLAFIALARTVQHQFQEVQGAFWIGPFKVETLSSNVINTIIFRPQWELVGWTAVAGLLTIALFAVVIVSSYRYITAKNRLFGQLAFTTLVIPTTLLTLASLPPLQPAFQDRYLSFYAPLLYTILAIGMWQLWSKTDKKQLYRTAVSLFAALWAVGIVLVLIVGNNQGWRPSPHFMSKTMSTYIKDHSRAGSSQVVSTSLWTFLDMHVTIGNTLQTRLYYPDGIGKYGNGSAVYDRSELQVKSLYDIRSDTVWIVDESGSPLLKEVPDSWQKLYEQNYGYAKLSQYLVR